MRRRLAGAVALAAALSARASAADVPIAGITIGSSVPAVVAALGFPASVETSDAGNRFAYAVGSAYADDDGVVRAVDTTTGTVRVDVEGKPKALTIGVYTLARADAELAAIAEYAGSETRTYRLSPERELVLTFATPSHVLSRVTYGQRGAIARMNVLPDDSAKIVPYKAPRMLASAIAGTNGTQATIVRLQIDRYGTVSDVSVVVPSSDAVFDAGLKTKLVTDHFVPAKLGGRAIAGTVFRELRH